MQFGSRKLLSVCLSGPRWFSKRVTDQGWRREESIAEREYYAALAPRYRSVDDELPLELDIFRAIESATAAGDVAGWTLDLGCGTGRYFHAIKHTQRIVGLDLTLEMLRRARAPIEAFQIEAEGIDLTCGSAYALPLRSWIVDRVVAIGVLAEHVALDDVVLGELARVLRPHGELIMTVRPQPARSLLTRIRRAAARAFFGVLPATARQRVRRRLYLAPHGADASSVRERLDRAGFLMTDMREVLRDTYPHTFVVAVRRGSEQDTRRVPREGE